MNANRINSVNRIVAAVRTTALSAVTIAVAFAALGVGTGIVAPQAAQAQGLVEIYNGGSERQVGYLFTQIARDRDGNYLFTNRVGDANGNSLFTNVVCNSSGNYLFSNSKPASVSPSDWGVAIPFSSNVTKHTTGGYTMTVESEKLFSAITDGNYLFAFGTDGNYLFTNSASGLLTTPGGWGMDLSGNFIAPDGSHVQPNAPGKPRNSVDPNAPGKPRNSVVPAVSAFMTPEGYTLTLYKDGSRSVTLPNADVFVLLSVGERSMNPSGVYYD